MTQTSPRALPARLQAATKLSLASLSLLGLTLAQAALTDISQTPLITAAATPVKANVLFVMDDSGSMDGDYLPEAANFSAMAYGSHTSQCNGMAYNPATNYTVPVTATGTPLASGSAAAVLKADATNAAGDTWLTNASYTYANNLAFQAIGNSVNIETYGSTTTYTANMPVTLYDLNDSSKWMVGIVTNWSTSNGRRIATVRIAEGSSTDSTKNLATTIIARGWPQFIHFTYGGSNDRLGYTYSSTGATVTNSSFYTECSGSIGNTTGSKVFTIAVVRSGTDAAQNLANWWTYYGTRLTMMKTVVSQVFKDLDDKIRIGYMTIHATEAKESTSKAFLHIRDFDATQKSNFYSYMNAAPASGSTPLRGSLSLAGRYFAKKARNQGTVDPVQYSCQRNFTILATDGQWNTGNENSSVSFGSYKIDGTAIGQQDGTADRPYRDGTGSSTGGSSDSLADIAMYYYATDLRTSALGNCTGAAGVDVCANNVKPKDGDNDTATWQHMTTFTMSLGQNGFLKYDPNYEKGSSTDYNLVLQGSRQWPNPVVSSDTDPGKVDDLWHAAVNGRGTFFNAADPLAVAQGLRTAITSIQQLTATGAAAATSTLQPVTGNNQAFIARYTSGLWVGDLRAYRQNTTDGSILVTDGQNNDLAEWSAAAKLQTKTSRKIYYAKGTVMRDFTYANLNADGLGSPFVDACTGNKLSQCASLNSTDKTAADSGTNMVTYLRGTELSAYRSRQQVLGDIVSSSPVYVGRTPYTNTDGAYAAYAGTTATRRTMVYVGANDGMLHAFDASTGDEVWAFVPAAVRANLYKLADVNYDTNHQYFVDGSPTVADVKIGTAWKTVLISGLGGGGKAYFALDITDPDNPKPLWEFTNANLGLTYANPLVVQRPNGNWVVALSSGYNNVGDGAGHLFLLDVATGSTIADVSTSTGNAATPAGLGPIAAWVDSANDTTAKRYYAGDTLGNVWRFDPEGLISGSKVVKLAQLVRSGVAQPITTAPVLAQINYNGFITPAVFIGTGRMLGLTDVQNKDVQSIYAIRDNLATTGWGDVRASGKLVQQTLTTSGNTRTATRNPVDWSSQAGWFVDLTDSGERINVDMMLRYNTLVAGSNVPVSVASCEEGNAGYAWLYYLDITFGSNTGTTVATKLNKSMVVGLGAYNLADGTGGVVATYSQGNPQTLKTPKLRTYLKAAKKSNWRELMDR